MNRALRSWTAAVILLSTVALSSCSAQQSERGAEPPKREVSGDAPQATPSQFAGTVWRLVEIQSMDDAVGTVRPDDPSVYTMRLNRDGTVNLRLDCNRANGTWSAEAGADGAGGRFEFGPLATTQAICPPGSLDERVSADAAYVRSYRFEGDRLYLSLMADGGIYAWEPDEGHFLTEPDAALETAIRREFPDYRHEIIDIESSVGRARYVYGRIDLNEDGEDEVLVYLLGSIFCGTGGCNLLVFTHPADGYTLVNDFPISREPVIVSPRKTAGWHDLIRLESGGGAPASYVRHTFDGTKYVESERLPADEAPEGARVLTGGFTFEDGIPLEPRS